jgi:TRAP-type mannitol/chloroaromatic compound transport system permease large subunit
MCRWSGSLGFDLIWYGVLYTITCQIAYMTPPFGYNLFLMRAMAPPEIKLRDIYRSIIPFVAVMTLALVLVMMFPQIALWLPDYVYGQTQWRGQGEDVEQFLSEEQTKRRGHEQ